MKNIRPFPVFKTFRLKHLKRNISFLIIIAFLNMVVGCYYYKVNTKTKLATKDIIEFQNNNKFIIVHSGIQIKYLKIISIENNVLYGSVSDFKGHQKYKTTNPETSNRYKINNESDVINEVHIYISGYVIKDNGKISFPLSSITKIEIYDPDHLATIASWVFGAIGITALVAVTLFIIVLLTKKSCPFIYVWDGKDYKFTGEIYSGAVHPPLERNDYLPLPDLKQKNGEYNLKITNEIHEIQHTNLTKLIAIDHPEGSTVLIDKYGVVQTSTNMEFPLSACNLNGKNILNLILNKDSLSYLGDEAIETDGIIMNFKHPKTVSNCKLFIRAKNTFWLDYIFGKFYDLFGSSFNKWNNKQKTASESSLIKWSLDQNIPLSVYIEKNNKWEFVDYYNLSGPMAYKEDVLPIDLTGIDSDTIKIKLESGSYFWDIDYVGADFTKNLELKSLEVPLQNAVNNKGENITNLLKDDDSTYYIQPNVGDEAMLTFSAPKTKSTNRSVFLHSKGYYEILRNPSGIADRKYLVEFRKPGRFNKFSIEMLQLYNKNNKK